MVFPCCFSDKNWWVPALVIYILFENRNRRAFKILENLPYCVYVKSPFFLVSICQYSTIILTDFSIRPHPCQSFIICMGKSKIMAAVCPQLYNIYIASFTLKSNKSI